VKRKQDLCAFMHRGRGLRDLLVEESPRKLPAGHLHVIACDNPWCLVHAVLDGLGNLGAHDGEHAADHPLALLSRVSPLRDTVLVLHYVLAGLG